MMLILIHRYDEATRKLIEAADFARQQYQEVENRLRDLDRDLTKLKVLS